MEIVVLQVESGEDGVYTIGCVMPPKGFEGEVHDNLQNLWDKWNWFRSPQHTDSEFVDWLVREHNWVKFPMPTFVTFNV